MKKFTSSWLALVAALISNGALAQVTPLSSVPRPAGAPTLAPGLYVSVIDGQISLSNKGGTSNFSAGQFGYTASVTKPPVVVPPNPALKFTPPPAFSTPKPASGSGAAPKSNTVDCEVR